MWNTSGSPARARLRVCACACACVSSPGGGSDGWSLTKGGRGVDFLEEQFGRGVYEDLKR